MESNLISPPKPTRTVLVSRPAVLFTPTLQLTPSFTPPSDLSLSFPMMRSTTSREIEITDITKSGSSHHGMSKLEVVAHACDSLESRLVDRTIDNMSSLPQVCGQVALQQKDQSEELHAQQRLLVEKQEHLQRAKQSHGELQEEVARLQREIYLSEEMLCTKLATCRDSQNEITQLIRENGKLERHLEDKEGELAKQTRHFDGYQQRMEAHVAAVAQTESGLETYKNMSQQKTQVEALLQEKQGLEANPEKVRKMLQGDYEKEMRHEIDTHQRELQASRKEVQQLEKMILSCKKEQASLIQSTEVLRRRNNAQLTRLRKRLKEVQARNRHWRDQASQLQDSIDAFKMEHDM